MSDALCGPSNPLQQFKQQTEFDRTLQQDRLTARHTPSQGFRSADPNAGLLDPEFEAFQAGLPPSDFAQLQPLPREASGPSDLSQAPSWAHDFGRMNLSPPSPFHQGLPFRPASDTTGWAQSFQQHISQTAPRPQISSPSPQVFQHMARYGGMNNYQPTFNQIPIAQPSQSKGKAAATEVFDDAAFERAFDEARDSLMAETDSASEVEQEEPPYATGVSTGNMEPEEFRSYLIQSIQKEWKMQEQLSTESLRTSGQESAHNYRPREHSLDTLQEYQLQLMLLELQNKRRLLMARQGQEYVHDLPNEMAHQLVQPRSEQDPVAEQTLEADQSTDLAENEQAQNKAQNDDDALAMTAQELLEKVDHNQTEKFRNSQFLALMRKLRDREVRVEGDQMVETVRPLLSQHIIPPSVTPDSTYGSGNVSPDSVFYTGSFDRHPRSPRPEFDSHVEWGWDREHDFDHWESPYR